MEALFPKGHVLGSGDVLERRGFVQEITLRLLSGDSVMLAGPRRTGKTSVAVEALRRLAHSGCYVLNLDLFHVTSMDDFAVQLMAQAISLRTGPLQKFSHTVGELYRMLQRADVAVTIHDLEIHARLNPATQDANEIIDAALSILEDIAKKDHRRVVVLLDEFQETERLGGTLLLKRMRSVMQQQTETSYLFLGSEPSLLHALFADRRQAFYRFATMLHLPTIPDAEWETYITKKFNQVGITISHDAVILLLKHTGGHPFCVMAALGESYYGARLGQRTSINVSEMFDALSQAALTLEPIYDELWRQILAIHGGAFVARQVAYNHLPYRGLDATVARRALTKLRNLSILQKLGRGEYLFVEPMFQQWILGHIPD